MKRIALILTATLLALALLAACSSSSSSQSTAASIAPASSQAAPASSSESTAASTASSDVSAASSASETGELVLTVDELAAYNGKDGQPAYVAVDGVIYDVTDVPEWAGGEHYSGLTAGQDLTEEIKNQSPHGLSVLDGLPVVGTLAT